MSKNKICRFSCVLTVLCLVVSSSLAWAKGPLKEAVDSRIKGYEAQKDGAIDEAIACYEEAIKADPLYATPHNDLGILYEEKGWLDKAEAEYKKALSIDPNYANAHSNLALLYEAKGDLDKAIFHWSKRVNMGETDSAWTRKAKEKLARLEQQAEKIAQKQEKARLDERKERLAQHETERDEKVKAYYNRGKEYYRQKDYAKAIAEFSQVRNTDPDHIYVSYAERYIDKAKTNMRELKKQELEAEKRTREQVKKELETETRRERAERMKQKEDKFQAELQRKAELKRAITEKMPQKEERRTRGAFMPEEKIEKEKDLLMNEIEKEDELLSLVKIRDEKDARIEAYYNQGKQYYKLRDYTKAILEFKKVLELGPHHIYFPYAYRYMKMAENKLRQREEGELQALWSASEQEVYSGTQAMIFRDQEDKQVLDLESEIIKEKKRREEERARKAKEYFDKGMQFQKKGDYPQALEAFEKVLEITPGDQKIAGMIKAAKEKIREESIEKHYSQGMEYYRQRDYDKANSEFEKMNGLIAEATREKISQE